MSSDLGRVEGDLQIIKQAMGLERPPRPDSPIPHLLLALSGIFSILLAWLLEILGSAEFPLIAALIIGLPPLLAMILWARLKARDPLLAATPTQRARSRREFWWQILGTAALVAILMACGLNLISAPVILSLVAILAVSMLNRPIVDGMEFSSIGWFVGLALLAVWMIFNLPVPLPRGSIVGLILIIGGSLAAGIATLSRLEQTVNISPKPPINFNGLDTAIHGPIRLGALTALQVDGPLDFTTLKVRLEAGDGSLALHLGRLEESGYIACKKSFVGKRPKSTYQITPAGRHALREYLHAMQQVIDLVKGS